MSLCGLSSEKNASVMWSGLTKSSGCLKSI